MTEKELKKLTRTDLLQMLIRQSREYQALQEKYEAAQLQLQQRTLTMEESGSIAEAALRLNGVFEAAQEACRQYTESVARRSEECDRYEQESRLRAQQMLEDTQKQCDRMLSDAKARTQKYWDDLLVKTQDYFANQEELQRLFRLATQKETL